MSNASDDFPEPDRSRDDGQPVTRDRDVDVTEVVLARPADNERFFGHSSAKVTVLRAVRQGAGAKAPEKLTLQRVESRPGGPCLLLLSVFYSWPQPPPAPSCPSLVLTTSLRYARYDALVVLTTVANADEAVVLVRALLDRRLIACGTLLGTARSLYRWEGKVADESEVIVLAQDARGRLRRLTAAFDELHPYKVPESWHSPVVAGSDKYLGWIRQGDLAGDSPDRANSDRPRRRRERLTSPPACPKPLQDSAPPRPPTRPHARPQGCTRCRECATTVAAEPAGSHGPATERPAGTRAAQVQRAAEAESLTEQGIHLCPDRAVARRDRAAATGHRARCGKRDGVLLPGRRVQPLRRARAPWRHSRRRRESSPITGVR